MYTAHDTAYEAIGGSLLRPRFQQAWHVRPKGIGRRICPSCGLTGFPPFSGGWCWYQATLSHNLIFMGVGIPGVGLEFGRATLAFFCV